MVNVYTPTRPVRIINIPQPIASFKGKNNEQKSRVLLFLYLVSTVKNFSIANQYFTSHNLTNRIPGLTEGYLAKRGRLLEKWHYLKRRAIKLPGIRPCYEYQAGVKASNLLQHMPADRMDALSKEIIENNQDLFAFYPDTASRLIRIARNSIRPTISKKAVDKLIQPVTSTKQEIECLAYAAGDRRYYVVDLDYKIYDPVERDFLPPHTAVCKSESAMRATWKDIKDNNRVLLEDQDTGEITKV